MAEQRYNPNGRRPANGSRNPNAGRRPAPAPNGRRPAPRKRKKKSAVSAPLVGLLLLAVAGIGGGIWLIHSKGKDGLNTNSNTPPTADVSMTDAPGAVTTADSEVTYTTAATITLIQTTGTTVTTEAPGKVTGIKLSFYETTLKVGDDTVMPLVTMEPSDAKDVSEKWESSNNAVATVDNIGRIKPVGVGNCTVRVTSVSNPKIYAEVKVKVTAPAVTTTVSVDGTTGTGVTAAPAVTYTTAVGADGKRTDIEVRDGITYIQGLMIVNKSYPLPKEYNPGGMTADTKAAFDEMVRDASAAGLSMKSVSDFRSYETQDQLYKNYCNRDGQVLADTYSARPGHSEHQTGMAIDINCAGSAFDNTPEAKWLAENCWKYGFILRYPQGKESITGYQYESWHIRYVGKDWAKKITESGLTLEEYFQIDSKYAS